MKKSAIKVLVIIAFIVSTLGFIFIGLPWAIHVAFSTFGISVSYEQAIALLSLTIFILNSLKE